MQFRIFVLYSIKNHLSIDDVPEASTSDSFKETSDSVPIEEQKTRKRKRNIDKWKTTVAKKAKNSEMPCVSVRETPIDTKIMGIGCANYRFKCQSKITVEERKILFKEFWDLKDHSRLWDYIVRSTSMAITQDQTAETCPDDTNCSKKRTI